MEFIDEPTEEQCLYALAYGASLELVKTKSIKICQFAVEDNGLNILFVPEELKTVELLSTAVKNNWSAITMIKNPSYELKLLAIQQDSYALNYFENPTEEMIKLANTTHVFIGRQSLRKRKH